MISPSSAQNCYPGPVRTWLLAAALSGWALRPLSAQAPGPGAVVKSQDEIDWKVSGTLPSGTATHEYHLIYEDKTTHGVQTLVRFSRGFVLPGHAHTHDEALVILKGRLELEIEGRKTVLRRGSYAMIPGGTPHALRALGWRGCEMMISFSGPVDFKGLAK